MHNSRAVIEDTFGQLISISFLIENVCQLQYNELIAYEESMDWKMSCITWQVRDTPSTSLSFSLYPLPLQFSGLEMAFYKTGASGFFVYLYSATVSAPKLNRLTINLWRQSDVAKKPRLHPCTRILYK